MRRRLTGIALRLEGAAVIGDDVARVVDGLWYPQLSERQLASRPLLAPRARWPRWSHRSRHPLILQLSDDSGYDVDHELMLGGDSASVGGTMSSLRSRGSGSSRSALISRRRS